MDGNLVSILSWYDNEWGFSGRNDRYSRSDGKIDLKTIRKLNLDV